MLLNISLCLKDKTTCFPPACTLTPYNHQPNIYTHIIYIHIINNIAQLKFICHFVDGFRYRLTSHLIGLLEGTNPVHEYSVFARSLKHLISFIYDLARSQLLIGLHCICLTTTVVLWMYWPSSTSSRIHSLNRLTKPDYIVQVWGLVEIKKMHQFGDDSSEELYRMPDQSYEIEWSGFSQEFHNGNLGNFLKSVFNESAV